MTVSHFNELRLELEKGSSEKGHPFRFCTLATVGLDRMARLRTVVLRHLGKDLALTFYTDKRSKKVLHIKENRNVSLLFYHPGKQLQLRMEGVGVVIKDPERLKGLWKGLEKRHRKDYTTSLAPGSILEKPETLEYLQDENYFCALEVHPFKIEYLKLKKPDHLRIRFSRLENDWKREFLVP